METIIIAILGSSAFTAIVNAVIELLKNRSGKQSKQNKAVMFSLLFALQTYGEKLINRGKIDAEDYKQFFEMYAAYKACGGNGFAERIKMEVEALPLIIPGRKEQNK